MARSPLRDTPVARVSEATCGTGAPGFRFAYPGYISGSSVGMRESFRQTRAGNLSIERLPRQPLGEPTLRIQKPGEIDTGIEFHRLEHEYEIFRRDIAGCPGRMRASAEAAKQCIE